jgi:hypothetical protein
VIQILFVVLLLDIMGASLCMRNGWWKELLILAAIGVPVAYVLLSRVAAGPA